MILSLVAAISENGVIGNKGRLPWNLPDDLKHFHDLTIGHAVIMGRKTYESIPEKHRPLPDRMNIVITRRGDREFLGCNVAHSLDEAREIAQAMDHETTNYRLPIRPELTAEWRTTNLAEVFVIGGAEVYQQALQLAQRMYITRVRAQVEGDVFFPEVDWGRWREVSREEHPTDSRHVHPFTFLVYERKEHSSP